jgi:hypothetical protein
MAPGRPVLSGLEKMRLRRIANAWFAFTVQVMLASSESDDASDTTSEVSMDTVTSDDNDNLLHDMLVPDLVFDTESESSSMDSLSDTSAYTTDSEDDQAEEAAYHLDLLRQSKSTAYVPVDTTACTKEPLTIEEFSDSECSTHFRFNKEELTRMCQPDHPLGLPAQFRDSERHSYTGVTGWLLFLKRLSYPCRLVDLQTLTRIPYNQISTCFTAVLNWFTTTHGHLMSSLEMWKPYMPTFAQAISKAGCPLRNVWAFIDGTFRPTCRPGIFQGVAYNGHYKGHGWKEQALALPNGMMAGLYGPIAGHHHDSFLLAKSGLLDTLTEIFGDAEEWFVIYGDPAYPLSKFILRGFKGAYLTPVQIEFNRWCSSVRESVEWHYGKVVQYWAFVDFVKQQKILQQPVAVQYLAASILTNMHTCLRGNTTTSFFDLDPPSLESFLNGTPYQEPQ